MLLVILEPFSFGPWLWVPVVGLFDSGGVRCVGRYLIYVTYVVCVGAQPD